MAAVTGPPERMAAARDDLTPMLRQYVDLCAAYDDAVVLFRVGDFYKTFCETAETVARVCELTLVEREDSTGTYPMAGIPVDGAASYLERLLEAGHRLAIADQVEDPEETTGLVDRAVTRVVTPGTLVEDDLLGDGATYVAAVTRGGDDGEAHAVAAVDVSTGECRVTSVPAADRLREELDRLVPAELLVGPDAGVDPGAVAGTPMVTDHDDEAFERAAAADRVGAYVSRPEAVVENDAELRACGAVLAYAEYTQGDDGPLAHVSRVRRYDPEARLRLDATALRSLELFESRSPGGTPLFDVVDLTASAAGRRRLADWLRRPLLDRPEIERRHDAVEELAERSLARSDLRDLLAEVYDLERLAGGVARERADARDLRSLAATLAVVPEARGALDGAEADLLVELREALDPLAGVRDLIERAIDPDPPTEVTDGGVIREGFDAELDEIREAEREGREWVAALEARERERTGIDSLSVGYNQVHGYYIEVTDSNLDRVPDDYTRRQTLKNAERFYTPELKRREDEILGAAERADAREYERFREVRAAVAEETDRLQALADAFAALDALAALAAVAVDRDYVRPEMGANRFDVEAGRHPVVERACESFVPNGADLPRGGVAIVTGPNMSGKSTYMRQVALTCVLAQAGGFVPADAAGLPLVDRVFTRVGASDDIAGGESTFMREMSELTEILHAATEDSLVLLDEVGRGTSTADGLAIARATTEFVHDEVGATTLFATHYHDLTALAGERERVRNLHFSAERSGDRVTFLHRVAEGPSSSSYGVEVARMAGVPDPVVARAAALVDAGDTAGGGSDTADSEAGARTADSEAGAAGTGATTDAAAGDGSTDGVRMDATGGAATGSPAANGNHTVDRDESGVEPGQPGNGAPREDHPRDVAGGDAPSAERAVAAALREVEVADTTPLEALRLLADLQARLGRRGE